jgi:PH-interacting protein
LLLHCQGCAAGAYALPESQRLCWARGAAASSERHPSCWFLCTAGAAHALGLAELRQRYSHLPSDALQRLLAQLLARRRAEAPQPAARGLTSLLESGALSVLGGSAAAAAAAAVPPAWLRPGATLPSQPRRLLLLRECGLTRGAQHAAVVAPPADVGRQLAHQTTVRGHRFAVYCLAYDRTGRYVITGSDDRLVKVIAPYSLN